MSTRWFKVRRSGLLLLPLIALVSLASQRPDDDERIRVEVDAVNVLVTVIDKKSGQFIKTLSKEHFTVSEDGVEQEITNFSRQTNLPLTIALCIDTSSSVKLKLEFEKEAALDFLYTIMRPTDKVLLAEFDTGVTLLHDFTSNPNDLVNEIKKLRAGGGTSLYDAIYLIAEQKMLYESGRRTMVILSDGSDLTSTTSFVSALRMAQRAELAIYALSTTRFGADIDHDGDNALKQLTENTGGRTFFPYSNSQFSKAFNEIQEELRSQYNLAYVPTNKKEDGSFRKIRVKIDHGNITVRHRKGYFAPLPGQEED
jgi:VWFA-related protein